MIRAASTTANTFTASNTTSISVPCGGTDRVLVWRASIFDPSATNRIVSGVTYNSIALTKVRADEIEGSGSQRTEIWLLINPPEGLLPLTVTMGGTITQVDSVATCVTGAAQDTQPHASSGDTTIGARTTASASVTTTIANCLLLDVIELVSNTPTPDTTQTDDLNVASSQGSYKATTAQGSWATNWTFGSDKAVVSLVAIAPAEASFAQRSIRPRSFAPGIAR